MFFKNSIKTQISHMYKLRKFIYVLHSINLYLYMFLNKWKINISVIQTIHKE